MAISTFPAASAGGGIKSVQRGVASASGNVTITSVDITKSYVNSFSNGSSGAAPGTGSCSMSTAWATHNSAPQFTRDGGSLGMGGGTWAGGTTTLLTAVNGAYLSNATTLVVTGPCYWEVVEMN